MQITPLVVTALTRFYKFAAEVSWTDLGLSDY